jgi:HSP20 family protein
VATKRDPDPLAPWFGRLTDRLGEASWQPAADVFETDVAIVVRLELAGVAGADVSVTIDGEVLRIRGVRKPRVDATAERLHQMEIASGPFERAIRIGVPFERDRVTASLEEGLLRVVLPKRSAGPRRIGLERREET